MSISDHSPPTGWEHGALRRCLVLLSLFAVVSLATGSAVPWLDNSLEYKVKAGCLYNFARYVTWPDEAFAQPDSPIIFAVLGEDPFGDILDATLDGKSIGGRPTKLLRLTDAASVAGVHVLYVSTSEESGLDELGPQLGKSHTFCVSDLESYADNGGVARFYLRLGKVAFEINVDEADRRGLVVSSQLLKLATVLRDPTGGK